MRKKLCLRIEPAPAGHGLPAACARSLLGLGPAQEQGRQQQPIVATTTSTTTYRTSTAAPTTTPPTTTTTYGRRTGWAARGLTNCSRHA